MTTAAYRSMLCRRRVRLASGIAVALALGGAGVLGAAIASQREAPQPPPVASTVASPPTTQTASAHEVAGLPDHVARAPGPPSVDESPAPVTLPPSRPVSLRIPSIGVRSVVHPVGQADTGEIETPAGPRYDQAAWYRYSPQPGSLGPSILLGHVDSAADGPSVFFRLGELEPGDRVSVTRADGSVAVFAVDGVRRFAKEDFPTRLVYGDIDHAGLRILTCGGPFDTVAGHYLDNVIVFASLVRA